VTPTATALPGSNKLAFSVAEAAAAIGLGERTLWRLIEAGSLGPVIRVGRRTIIPSTTLAAFLEREASAVPA